MSAIVTVPEAEPTALGANETERVHEAPGIKLAGQLFVWLNGGVAAMLETCNGPVPALCNETVLAVLTLPAAWEEKDRLAGVTAAAGAVPVPLSGTTCVGPKFPASSFTIKDPVVVPATTGVNHTEIVQVEPGMRGEEQLFVAENPLPLVETFNPFSGLPPKLVIVTVWGGLLVPTFCAKVKDAAEKLIAEGGGLDTGTGVAPNT